MAVFGLCVPVSLSWLIGLVYWGTYMEHSLVSVISYACSSPDTTSRNVCSQNSLLGVVIALFTVCLYDMFT